MASDPVQGRSAALRIGDDTGEFVLVEGAEAETLWSLTSGFEAATISACGECRCRVLASVALVDLIDAAPALPEAVALRELADDAPTLHVYVDDPTSQCAHRTWRDPLAEEWADVIDGPPRRPIR